jgi:hypothetical protein
VFALAVRRRDRHEEIGQVVRIIVAAPGSARVPQLLVVDIPGGMPVPG